MQKCRLEHISNKPGLRQRPTLGIRIHHRSSEQRVSNVSPVTFCNQISRGEFLLLVSDGDITCDSLARTVYCPSDADFVKVKLSCWQCPFLVINFNDTVVTFSFSTRDAFKQAVTTEETE